jgi:hypothetical protein
MRTTRSGMSITHTERVAAIAGSNDLSVVSYSVNPGLHATFPWLSAIANRFEKYKFRSLKFRYVPMQAAVAGALTMAFDFDPMDPPPTSVASAMTYHDFLSTSVWQGGVLNIDLRSGDMLPQKNTRPAAFYPEQNYNLYDTGKLHVLVEGFFDTSNIGYLEVIYEVELMVHQVLPGDPADNPNWSITSKQATSSDIYMDLFGNANTGAAVIRGNPAGKLVPIMTEKPRFGSAWLFERDWEGLVSMELDAGAYLSDTLFNATVTDIHGNEMTPASVYDLMGALTSDTALAHTLRIVALAGNYFCPGLVYTPGEPVGATANWLFTEVKGLFDTHISFPSESEIATESDT